MAFDSIFVSALCDELDKVLSGGRIVKIQQPEKDIVLLSVKTDFGTKKLLMSAANGSSRISVTDAGYEVPKEAPAFCMLLRKYLTGAIIKNILQEPGERIIKIILRCYNEMRELSEKQLIAELIGNRTNIVLTDENGRIIDCLKRISCSDFNSRALLPGMYYELPAKQKKIFITGVDSEQFDLLINKSDQTSPVQDFLLSTFAGISVNVANELSFRSSESYVKLPACLKAFSECVKNCEIKPYLTVLDGEAVDFSYLPLTQYGSSAVYKLYDSYSSLVEDFYSEKEESAIKKRHTSELSKTVNSAIKKAQKRLALRQEELSNVSGRDEIRKNAELITANIYRIKNGSSFVECEDYYNNNSILRIELNPLKSPQENANLMYKEYAKQKRAEVHLLRLIEEEKTLIEYLYSVQNEIFLSDCESDYAEIRNELVSAGLIKKTNISAKKTKSQNFFSDNSFDGFQIIIGKNNRQNDEITFKLADRGDFWCHVHGGHGSHVIIRCGGLKPPQEVIEKATEYAAEFSSFKFADKCDVDYTIARNVKRHPTGKPGMVIYSNYSTITVVSKHKENG